MKSSAKGISHQQLYKVDEIEDPSTAEQRARPYWPHWCVHGRLYDLERWLEDHPGGKDFLLRARGTDCSAVFETHHIRQGPVQEALKRFDIGPAPASECPHFDWENYRLLRQRVAKVLRREDWRPGPTLRSKAIAFSAILICLVIPFLWPLQSVYPWFTHGLLALTYVTSFLTIGAFGHVFLHQQSKLGLLVDLFGLSSNEWKTTHCLEHHPFPNDPDFDSDVGVFRPLIDFVPGRSARLQRLAPFLLLPLYACAFFLIRIALLIGLWRERQDRAKRTLLYLVGNFGWLFLWWLNGAFWVGLGLECVVSFLFILVTMCGHNDEASHQAAGTPDFIAYQLSASRDFGPVGYYTSMVRGFFLGSQSLHHLFPTLDPVYHRLVEREVVAMGYRRRMHSTWSLVWGHLRYVGTVSEGKAP